ncbi:DNA-processing protein DprA [Microbacterium sp. CFBP9034]|uniref:DNA-processing protein DprA n=1 Tax=Microbacterium sp. CFBP9034 TaxID=3096540 RepID=UPI002A698E9E|nr:DNA-processing protein DprA [Microbacterium sp. CFBP9034]MDY0909507.1 DNA-processing protein DprA [Microbacterium sp. CFBP9034]
MTRFDISPGMARRALAPLGHPDDSDREVIERYATVVWSHLVEPGDSAAGRLVRALGPQDALRVVVADGAWTQAVDPRDITEGRKRWMPRLDADAIALGLQSAGKAGVSLVTRADDAWPHQLDDLETHAPMCLWLRGDAEALQRLRPSVAIVGARAATSYGDHVALELAAELAGGGIPVVSGGAYGIDGAAHRAALQVGGLTVALLAGGVDRAYPAGHADLIERVAAAGAVVSEVPCGSAPTKWRFLQRNRLIAALTDATVVVEAGWRSGSLNTAGHAAALSRRLGAVPGPITSAASAGTHRLLREYGAQCITSAADVRDLLGLSHTLPDPRGDGRPHTDDTTRVRDALSVRAWRDSADIARRAGMAAEEVEAILGLLHLEGAATRGTAGWRMAPTEG